MRKISLLCPTRGRPDRAMNLLRSVEQTQTQKNELLFCLQEDDPMLKQYPSEIVKLSVITPPRTTSYYWNLLADKSQGEMLMLLGDDVTCKTQGWDQRFNEVYDQYPDGIFNIKFLDGRNKIGRPAPVAPNELPAPHPVISRRWYDALGYFTYPGLRHYCVDDWIDSLAKKLGRSVNLYDVEFTHLKQYKADDDVKTTMRRERWTETDQETFKRCARHLENDFVLLQSLMNTSH
jgi:hypothetical protein